MKHIALYVFAFAVVGCQPNPTVVDIHIEAPGLTISTLQLTVTLADGRTQTQELPATLPGIVAVKLPDVATAVTATAEARDLAGITIAQATATAQSQPHHTVTLALRLGDGAPPDMLPDLPPSVPSLTLLTGAVGGAGETDGKGADARFNSSQGLAIAGDILYVSDTYGNALRAVTMADGTVTTIQLKNVSNGTPINLPYGTGLAWDGKKYLYLAEYYDCSVQQIDPVAMTIKHVAGNGTCGLADGDVDHGQLNNPSGLAFDGNGLLWIVDSGNCAIRTFDSTTGLLATAAGASCATSGVDGSGGTGGSARFVSPDAIVAIGTKLYITDHDTVRVIDTTMPAANAGYVTTALGAGADGFTDLRGIAPGDGNSLIAFDQNGVVHRIIPGASGIPPAYSIVAGSFYAPDPVDGNNSVAVLQSAGLAVNDGNGYVWFADTSTVRKLQLGDPWAVSTVAGVSNHADASSMPPRLAMPAGLAWDGNDFVYIAGYASNRVQRYQWSTGQLAPVAGGGASAHEDGVGDKAGFSAPSGLALDAANGMLYVTDRGSDYIRRITLATAQVDTIAGVAGGGAVPAFDDPVGIVFDGDRTLYVADFNNNVIRTIDTMTNAVGVLAGTPGVAGSTDAPAASASFAAPSGLAFDRAHKILYVAEIGNQCVRKIDLGASGMPVTLLSGSIGAFDFVDDTTLLAARYRNPAGLGFDDATGLLYVADTGNERVRKLDLAGNRVTTIVGSGLERTKPGPLPADINGPFGVLPTPMGLLVTSETENTLLLAK